MILSQPNQEKTFPLVKYLAFVCLSLLHLACDRPQPHIGEPLLAALQSGNWQAVYEESTKDTTFQKMETLGLRGHACILLNQNNESYRCLNDMDTVQLKKWLGWAEDFVHKNPKLPAAYYLQGDALMRTGNKTEALRSFTKAIELDSDYALARNARATVYALEGKFESALGDAIVACQKEPTIAEFVATRAAIAYQNKSLENAQSFFDEALKISPGFALALNGHACSKFFNINGTDNPKNQLDSISMMLYAASAQLDIPAFRENTRSLIFEFENTLFPEQVKTPYFRVSDFLDWETLHQLSVEDKNDFFRNALGYPLPDTINSETLHNLNLILGKKELFENYEKYVPANLKQALKKENEMDCKEGTECYNRLAIEKIYEGLIVPFFDRKPGMSIQAQSQIANKPVGAKLYDMLEDVPKTMSFARDMGNIVSAGTKRPEISLITYAVTKTAEVFALGAQIALTKAATRRMENDPTHLANLATVERYKPELAQQLRNPGGVYADFRQKHVDDISKPYFLICNYGLGYD